MRLFYFGTYSYCYYILSKFVLYYIYHELFKGEELMTQEEIKRLEKKISTIQDPLGKGFPSFRRVLQEMAFTKNAAELNILQEYMDWKSRNT